MSIFKKNTPANINIQSKPNPFMSVQNELNKAMSEFYNWFEPFNFPVERFENLKLNPAVDIVEDKEQFKIEVEMPGMGEDDISVSVDNGILTIKGEKTISQKNKDKNYMSREIAYGSYERCISLPDSVDIQKAKASFKKGMLWVVFPKKSEHITESKVLQVEKM